MKKIKKIMAMLLAMVMVLGMTVTASAAKDGAKINVTGLSTNGTQIVTIYEIYTLDANDNSWVKASWVPEGVTPETLITPENLKAMKEAALKTTGVFKESTDGSVRFDNVQSGAYLVLAVDETRKVTYNTMVAETYRYDEHDHLIAPDTADVVAKAETYTTGKTQDDEDGVVEVGDLVKYSITTTVPYQDGKVEEFSVSDELTGATYYLTGGDVKGVAAVNEITVNGVPSDLTIDEQYNGKTAFTVDLMSLVDKNNTKAGATVVITYTAKVNAVDKVTNKASSSHDNEGTTVHAYTGQAEITKYAEDETTDDLNDNAKLAGAQFALYRTVDDKTREYAVINDETGYITGEWIKVSAQDGKFTIPGNVSTVTTNDKGIATVKGLNVGTYYFDEVVAPDGYAINEADKMVEVRVVESEHTIFGSTYMIDSTLSSLPATGGIGTTIFTIGGCAIMVAAAGLFFASRRKANK